MSIHRLLMLIANQNVSIVNLLNDINNLNRQDKNLPHNYYPDFQAELTEIEQTYQVPTEIHIFGGKKSGD